MSNALNFFGTNGKSSAAPDAQPRLSTTKTQQHGGITWTDIQNPTPEDTQKLADQYGFHPLHLETSLLDGSLPQQEREATYLFLLLHIPVYDKAQNKTATSQVAVFLGKGYLITLHTDINTVIRQLFDRCEQDEKERSTYFKKSAGFLLYGIIKDLLDDLAGLVKMILNELDQIEDAVFDATSSDAAKIAGLRQKILRLRRTTAPLKTVLADLDTSIHQLVGENLSHHYRNLIRTADWLAEITTEAEETVEIYKDADFTASTERTNEILAVLTIIFTLAIPATIIGTFYGMNILLPGGIEVGPWNFFGTYTTLIVVVASSLIPGTIMYWSFKKKHWF